MSTFDSPENYKDAVKDFQTTTNIKSKSDKSFGLKIAKTINNEVKNTYFASRNARFVQNERLSNGKQDVDQFKSYFDVDGKVEYIKLRFKSIMIVATAVQRLVGRWMNGTEKVVVKAVDSKSTREREQAVNEAEFVMNHQQEIAALTELSGEQIVKPDQFIPEDKEELDQWATEKLMLPEEILFEKGVNRVLAANGWYDVIKRKCLTNAAVTGLIGAEVSVQRDGMLLVEWIEPKSLVYSKSIYDDFRDTSWRGRYKTLKVIEIREEYPKLSEEEIFEIAQKSEAFKSSNLLGFDNSWYGAAERPYDDFSVEVLIAYIKTSDSDIHRMSVTKGGVLKVDKKQNIPADKGKNNYVKKDKYNIYKGIWVRDTEIMLEWGLQKNMIRPQDPQELGDVEFPISLYMYNMHEMRNLAVPEKIEEPADALILTRLKIQQLVAKMRPAGNAYDVTAMRELDLGTGEVFNALELKKISDQTGDFYFSGKDAEGNNIGFPITPQPNTEGLSQLQGLIGIYNHHLQVLRDEVGINEMAEGQSAKPRVTNSNFQGALEVSFNATDYMKDAYLYLLKDVAKKVGCLLHDATMYGAKQYRELLKEESVKGRIFEASVELLPTEEQVAFLDSMITNAIQTNPTLIMYVDPFKLRRMARDNVKMAEQYFIRSQKRAMQGEMAKAQQQSEMNGKIQQQSAAAKAEADAALMKQEAELKAQEIRMLGENANKTAVISMFTALYSKGIGMPAELAPLAQSVIQNVMIPLVISNEEMQKEIVAKMQADQQAAMEQEQGVAPQEEQMMQEQPMM